MKRYALVGVRRRNAPTIPIPDRLTFFSEITDWQSIDAGRARGTFLISKAEFSLPSLRRSI